MNMYFTVEYFTVMLVHVSLINQSWNEKKKTPKNLLEPHSIVCVKSSSPEVDGCLTQIIYQTPKYQWTQSVATFLLSRIMDGLDGHYAALYGTFNV
jgi:hypothetical protein